VLDIVNKTPFLVALMLWEDAQGQAKVTVIVKERLPSSKAEGLKGSWFLAPLFDTLSSEVLLHGEWRHTTKTVSG
jgi:hypothetical protein